MQTPLTPPLVAHTPISHPLPTNPIQLRLLQMMEEVEDYAILMLDATGVIESWNKGAQRIKGYNAEEIVGQNFRLFYTPEDRQLDVPGKLLKEASIKGKVNCEGWRLKKNNVEFWASVSITAIYGEAGEVIGFAKITRDLTERKLAEKTIQTHLQNINRKNKELEEFVYIASHDLQEPLLNLMNFTELLQEEYAPLFDETAGLYFEAISQGAHRMRNLIRGLLDYSRLGQQVELSEVDCQAMLLTLQQDLSVSIQNASALIHVGALPTLQVYATEFRQLFQNLISNAIKFTTPNRRPEIHISAQATAMGWKFSIQDNGIGIPLDFQDKIFRIFQRLHRHDEYEGSGIGLAHCKKIVEMHGGDLSLVSTVGQGTTFFFTIPFQVASIT